MKIKQIILTFGAIAVVGAGCGASDSIERSPKTDNTEKPQTEEQIIEEVEIETNETSEIKEPTTETEADPEPDVDTKVEVEKEPVVEKIPEPVEPTVKEFNIISKKWVFEPSTITVNKDDRVRLIIDNIDVDHGFALSAFGINEKLLPGQVHTIEFTADKSGSFSFFCSVFCGSGHSGMRGTLIVQ